MGKRKPARGTQGALRFYMDVLGLEHLHYGLWDGGPLTFDGLKAAQERYTDHLIELIGSRAGSILDCGCGTGTTALKLRAHGLEVEGLTPDPYQHETFVARTGLTCHRARFQEFRPARRYDVVLMSESCGYIPMDQLFEAVRRAAPGGAWLVADYFSLYKDGSKLSKSGHLLSRFLAEAREVGLEMEYEEDITDKVTPTLDLARVAIDEKALPTARMLGEWLADRYPILYPPLFKTARFLLRKPIAKAESQRVLIDSDAFRSAKRYMIYRFRIPERDGPDTPGA
jgi:cyclopropane fatty-acyl-phospholipid synthase-like methyltransferase